MTSHSHESTVKLARNSTRWSKADSAGGFTMRYMTAMRNYLIEQWNNGEAVDQSLVLLLTHLSSKGFGTAEKGRLRDFLLNSTRAVVIAYCKRTKTTPPPLENITTEDPQWLESWRECLMGRVWRSMERYQHANPQSREFDVLRLATDHPQSAPAMLALRVKLPPDEFSQTLAAARLRFAQLLADEVADTLESPNPDDVREELESLDLLSFVMPVSV